MDPRPDRFLQAPFWRPSRAPRRSGVFRADWPRECAECGCDAYWEGLRSTGEIVPACWEHRSGPERLLLADEPLKS
jgi:hypothetical protein